jgi:hypothetical protein
MIVADLGRSAKQSMFILSFLIDAALLSFLLLVVAQIDLARDFARPLAVILFSAVASILTHLLFGGPLGAIIALIAYLAVFWYCLGFFFDLERKKKLLVFGIFIAVRIVWSLILA